MATRDYIKYNVEGLGENLNKSQIGFTSVKKYIEKTTQILKISSILETFRNPNYRTLNVNFILPFLLIFITSSAFGQGKDLTIEEFSYSNFKMIKNRTGFLSSHPIDNDIKKIEYTHLELNDNTKERIKKVILSTLKNWRSVGIVANLGKKEIEITNINDLVIKETTSNRNRYRYIEENFSTDGRLATISMSSLKTVSLIVTNENDTLVLLPKKINVFNKATSAYEDIILLYYTNLQSLTNILLQDRELINDVLTLKKHISALKVKYLELTDAEKVELNTNIQARIIKAIDSLKLPKYYLVSVNRTEPAAQTKSYFYIVEKHSNNRFYSLGKEHDDFPLMDTVLNSQILIDTIQLSINKDEMKKTVSSTDYTAHFSDYFDSGIRYDGKTQYSRGLGGPNLNSSDTLFMTTSDGGSYSNMRNPLYLDSFPSYLEFSKNYLLDVRGKDFPFSKLGGRGYSLVENHIYSKDSISFAINIKKGQNSEPINSSYGGTVYGSNKKEVYDYAEQFHKFYKGWKQEVEEEKQKKELAAEQEKEQQKQELAKKYGRKYVDAMYELKIIVGMPEDLVNVIVNKLYTVGTSSSSNNGNYYRLDPRYGTGWVSVWIKNKKVTSVTYH